MIKGSIVALVTPFFNNGKINYRKLKELIEFHIVNETEGILLLGTTGEGTTLSLKEKYNISKLAIKYVNKRVPVILNVGSNSTMDTIKLVKKLERLQPDAFLIITPYYNKTNEEGLYHHFKTIHDKTKIPIILYNVPSRTTIDMSIELIKRISKLKRIIGIKEASRDYEKLNQLPSCQNEKFSWFAGNDDRMVEDIKLGARGLIGVCTNSHPKIVKKIIDAATNQKYEEAVRLYLKIKKYINVLNIDVNPIMIKEAMNILKFDVGNYRLPLFETSLENKIKIKNILEDMNS